MCTSFRLSAGDGAVVVGRTMEFPNLLGARIAVVPRGVTGASTSPTGEGKHWDGTHGYIGVDGFGNVQTMSDGLNEAGLYVGLLYMPGFADYESSEGVDPERLMAPVDVAGFLLATCATTDEVKAAMADTVVWPATFAAFGFPPPHHVVAHDRTGASVVIEWRDGAQVVFDNPNGVATNWPHLDWHLTNLRNYVTLRPTNAASQTVGGRELSPMGQGTGLLGLPGDPSSPSRFVRASALVATLRAMPDATAAEVAAHHVLNALDLPMGFIRDSADADGDDHTLWSSIADLTNLSYAVRTYDDPTWRRVSFADLDLLSGPPRQIELPTVEAFPPLEIA